MDYKVSLGDQRNEDNRFVMSAQNIFYLIWFAYAHAGVDLQFQHLVAKLIHQFTVYLYSHFFLKNASIRPVLLKTF